jgi:hypothetical protein
MTNYADFAKEARDCREAAKRARKFIDSIGSDVDGMYLRFAEEQERRAAKLEAAMLPKPAGQVALEQEQIQQQGENRSESAGAARDTGAPEGLA